MHLLNEIQKVIEEENPKTFEDTMNIIKKKGWNIDTFATSDKKLKMMSAWQGYIQLIAISARMERISKKETATCQQYINSGKAIEIKNGLDSKTCNELEEIANKYHGEQFNDPLTLSNAENKYNLKGWEEIVRKLIIETTRRIDLTSLPISYKKINIIAPRCLLRRTYPQNLVNPISGNRNNQDWHQDSNLIYGGRQMVTLWFMTRRNRFDKAWPGIIE